MPESVILYDRCRLTIMRWLSVILLLVLLIFSACWSGKGTEETVPNRDIKTVMDNHVKDLMAIAGVVGVAIGALDDGTPYIMVLVIEETDEISQKVPVTLEGHPVRVIVSGEIKPMQGG